MSYKTDKLIPSLTEVRKKEREEIEKKQSEDAFIFLMSAIKYYDKNYPKTECKNVWTKDKVQITLKGKELQDSLEKMTENDLYGIIDIFDYFHDERKMNSIKDHDKRSYILARTRKLIPAYREKTELNTLQKQYEQDKRRIQELQKIISEKQKEFKEKTEEKKDKQIEIDNNIYICEFCRKECKSNAGLTSHIRTHEQKIESELV